MNYEYRNYCPVRDVWVKAEESVNMVGRGHVMVYRKYDVHILDCSRLSRWEQLARESAQEDRMWLNCSASNYI